MLNEHKPGLYHALRLMRLPQKGLSPGNAGYDRLQEGLPCAPEANSRGTVPMQ